MKFNSDYLNFNLAIYLICATGAVVAGAIFHQPVLAAVLALPALIWFLRIDAREKREISMETNRTDKQLRAEVIEAMEIAFSKLATADDEFKGKVAELLAEAAKHLGYPNMGGTRVYSSGYTLQWNRKGLELVAQARMLIDGYAPPST